METKEIQKLIDFIAHSGLDEVNIETNELKISVKRYSGTAAAPVVYQQPAPAPPAAPAVVTPAAAVPAAVSAAAPKVEESNLVVIKSPMIGTFYRTPNPEKPVFVEVGDNIELGQPICIIEAMKLFNEIEADVAGKIVKILVANATPVEYDQPLFLVEPA